MSCLRPRLRALFVAAAAAALIPGGNAVARSQGAVSPAAERSPFLGRWELDLARMPATYGPPPKRVVYTFADLGVGKWRTEVDITAPDGSVRHVAMEYRRDGRAVPALGDTADGDSGAMHSPAPNVLVLSIAKDKRMGSVRVYAVSADGKEMTESAAAVDGEGAPFVRNFHFRRIGD